MRIISGQLKGRKLSIPKHIKSRPTTDFAREGLFNWLDSQIGISGKVCIDFFTGSGMISFELISRGAKEVYAVDVQSANIAFIRKTSEAWGITNLKCIRGNTEKIAKVFEIKADIIFADPPFVYSYYHDLPELLIQLVAENGVLIIEHPKNISLQDQLFFLEERKYGNICFSIFKKH